MGEWQPIDTAPKDGAIIDVWVADPDGPRRATDVVWHEGYWVQARNKMFPVESFFDHDGVPLIKISHWMPRPAPPKQD